MDVMVFPRQWNGVGRIVVWAALWAAGFAHVPGCTTARPMGTGPEVSRAPEPIDAIGPLKVVSWNIRGYPERHASDTAWIHQQLALWCPDVVCVQEIANPDRVATFCSNDARLKTVAFLDSRDGMDNAIFTSTAVTLHDLPDPQGFQHPVQAALICSGGFDAVVVTVHLSWSNRARREQEMSLLRGVARDMARHDPDVMLVGDFNLKEAQIAELARELGMVVLLPAGQDDVGTTHAGNRYDHFVVSLDLAEEEAAGHAARIITFEGPDLSVARTVSDHLPIQASFSRAERYRDRP